MLTKALSKSYDSEKEEGKALSHYVQMKPQIRTTLKWRVEWTHVFEEVLNDNNNALRGQARPGIILEEKKKKSLCRAVRERGSERETERERGEESTESEKEREVKSRGGGEVGVLNSDRKFQQKKLAWILTTQRSANGYTQMLMCMHTHTHK